MDALKEVGRTLGKTRTGFEIEKRRGGLLPNVERSRGPMSDKHSYISDFSVNENNRKIALNLEFYPLPVGRGAQGAFHRYAPGVPDSAMPNLVELTTPGNLLLAIMVTQANAAVFVVPNAPKFYAPDEGPLEDPNWVIDVQQDAYEPGMNIGPPGAIQIVMAHRLVRANEKTHTPALSRPGDLSMSMGFWLYEIENTDVPVSSAVVNGFVNNGGQIDFSSLPGLVIGAVAFQQVDYGATPNGVVSVTGDIVQSNASDNDASMHGDFTSWAVPWLWVGQLGSGGVLSVKFATSVGYNRVGYAGAAVSIPHLSGRPLPTIPYPANRITFSLGGQALTSSTDLYASGVRVFIDGQDISQYIFGSPSGVVDLSNNRWDNIDLTLWVKTAGQHSLVVTCDEGAVDVDTRFEVF